MNVDDWQNHVGLAAAVAREGFESYIASPLIAKGQVNGVLELWHRKPLHPEPEWLEFLDALAGQGAIAIDNATLYQQLQTSNSELILAYDTTLEGWVKALDLRDNETEGHTRRVTELTVRLAHDYPVDREQAVHIRRGALLHDIGKMAVPDAILRKPGPLTAKEWEIMKRHPIYAYEWLSPIPYLRPAMDIPYCHHEKWDGSGYPRGLKANAIPLAARLFAVVDVWDALRSDRPYRPGWPEEKVAAYIQERAEKDFDPKVVNAFLKNVKKYVQPFE
jgi:HD-GYP domain-containing protein (c-di-GMP phosphodiesterase class II)